MRSYRHKTFEAGEPLVIPAGNTPKDHDSVSPLLLILSTPQVLEDADAPLILLKNCRYLLPQDIGLIRT
jgi:hypothetical protein